MTFGFQHLTLRQARLVDGDKQSSGAESASAQCSSSLNQSLRVICFAGVSQVTAGETGAPTSTFHVTSSHSDGTKSVIGPEPDAERPSDALIGYEVHPNADVQIVSNRCPRSVSA